VALNEATLDVTTAPVDLLFQRACALHDSGELVESKALCWAILKRQPRHVEALNRLGAIIGKSGDLKLAVQVLGQAILIDPLHVAATYNRGIAFYNLRQFDAALLHYDRVIELKPDFAPAHFSRGNALRDLGQLPAARASFERAIALENDDEECLVNLGNVLRDLGHFDAALEQYARALAVRGDCAEAHQCRGIVLLDLQQIPAALDGLDRAISLKPDWAEAHCNKASVLLLGGDFERGWAEHEWRRKNPDSPLCKDARQFSQPLWLGEHPIAGCTLLLHSEQGLGDTLQFCRYVKSVSDLGARVILEVPQPLVSLLENLEGVSQIVAIGSALPEYDYYCSLMSLPLALKTNIATIPNRVPYLSSSAARRHHWNALLGPRTKRRVGVVWSGGFRPHQPELAAVNGRRNIPLAQLARLRHSEIEFHSLQKGQPAESELTALTAARWSGPEITDHASELHDFSDTAALIEHLDLVISVDTSTAHLAGALGKPVWLLNRYDTCWRWMTDRTDSPWYPTMKLHRQPRPGDWDSVVEEVARDLMQFANSDSPTGQRGSDGASGGVS
jgi:tetratricopeptide (TPR) repeat protein